MVTVSKVRLCLQVQLKQKTPSKPKEESPPEPQGLNEAQMKLFESLSSGSVASQSEQKASEPVPAPESKQAPKQQTIPEHDTLAPLDKMQERPMRSGERKEESETKETTTVKDSESRKSQDRPVENATPPRRPRSRIAANFGNKN